MNEIAAIGAVAETAALDPGAAADHIQALREMAPNALATSSQAPETDFSNLVSDSLANMDAKVAHADEMVTRFALDDNTPIHQVTVALEEARLSVELAMQVRQRFVEGYRELMNMQL